MSNFESSRSNWFKLFAADSLLDRLLRGIALRYLMEFLIEFVSGLGKTISPFPLLSRFEFLWTNRSLSSVALYPFTQLKVNSANRTLYILQDYPIVFALKRLQYWCPIIVRIQYVRLQRVAFPDGGSLSCCTLPNNWAVRDRWHYNFCIKVFQYTTFDIIKFSLAARLRGHKQRKLNDMFIHFFCLCPLGLTIKLNLNISKVVYCLNFF